MKKTISALLALIMTMSMMIIAADAENTPKVYVDGSEIAFTDQSPVIVGEGTTLVPARVVFNAMGASVDWDNDLRRVRIDSANNVIRIYIYIDNPVMEVYTFTSLMNAEKTEVNLKDEAVPCIMNDRTMIPLRAISESLEATVDWDQENYTVNITTAESSKVTAADKTSLYLTCDAATVSAGDTVDVYLNAENFPDAQSLSAITATINYDKTAFEYVSSSLYSNGAEVESTISVDNPDYTDTALKIILLTINGDITSEGKIAKVTFKALSDNGGQFSLVNSYELTRGYNTSLNFSTDTDTIEVAGNTLDIDVNPITVPNTAAAEVTATPEATVEPTATATAEATAEPTATATPEATAEPTATATPEA